jgi:programmed cell death protein 4
VGVAGSSKRNILRRGAPPKERKAGAPTNVVDDGTGYNDSPALDEQDPNYDSEHETPREAARFTRPTSGSMDVGAAKMTLQKFKHLVEPLIHEYFVSGDAVETLTSLQELDAAQYSYEFVKRVVNMSLDKSDRERELVSRLLSTAYPDTLSSNSIGKGFERLLELSDEIEKDAPAAKDMMATFLARAVIDEILPPSFIADPVVANLGGEIIDHTKVMLSRDHAGAKLERIWGPGDGRPVEEMKLAVDQLLLEYVAARQVEEAARCVKQLNAPLFHHELVKRLLVIALEKSEEDRNALSVSFFSNLLSIFLTLYGRWIRSY